MSSIIFTKLVLRRSGEQNNLFVMQVNQDQSLSGYVGKVIQLKGLTHRQVEERAKRRGFNLAHSHISKIISGAVGNLTIETIKGLAAGLGVDISEIFAVISGEVTPDTHDLMEAQLLSCYRKLPADGRTFLVATAENYCRMFASGVAAPSDVGPIRHDLAVENLPTERKQVIAVQEPGKVKTRKK